MSSQNKTATDTKPSWQARVHRWWEVTEGVCGGTPRPSRVTALSSAESSVGGKTWTLAASR